MKDDTGLDLFWRVLAAEHIQGSLPEGGKERVAANRFTRSQWVRLPPGEDRDFLHFTLRIGCLDANEAEANPKGYREGVEWLVARGARHAPGRAVEFADTLPEPEGRAFLNAVVERYYQPECNFSRRQIKRVYDELLKRAAAKP